MPSEPASAGISASADSARKAASPSSARLWRALGDGWGGWKKALPWVLALPFGMALVVLARRRKALPASGRAVQRAARHDLEQELRAIDGTETRPRQVAARIEEAWRAFLAARWEVPPGTPTPRWGELLEAQGADSAAARELVRLADDLHYLRYAPQLSARETLCAEVIERSRRVLGRLR